MTDASGAVTERLTWDTYGQPIDVAGDRTYGFTGHGYDEGAGLHQARARWYDPSIGSFLSVDPVPAVNRHT